MTPLQINVLSGLLQNQGLRVNPTAAGYYGTISNTGVYSPIGSLSTDTVLNNCTRSIIEGVAGASYYTALTTIGANTIPALGNSRPPTYTLSDSVVKYGFIGRIALQALYELNQINTPPTPSAPNTVNLSRFAQAFQQAFAWKNNINNIVVAATNATTFRQGTYSNMNDLITADITGITLATQLWGNDLINIGRAIDLSQIEQFGNPAILLKTMTDYNAVTEAVSLAMGSQLSGSEIEAAKKGEAEQQTQATLYACFKLITGGDLQTILDILNIKTSGLNSLADLLNPMMMFPTSYTTLTFPMYGASTGASKNYDFIYINGGVNPRVPTYFADRLRGVLPSNLAAAAYAFSMSLQQVKNIKNMTIGPFAQVVANIETTKDLPLANNPGSPASIAASTFLTNTLATGTGPNGTYTMSSFFGSLSGQNYNSLFAQIQTLIQSLTTTTLADIYQRLYTAVHNAPAPVPPPTPPTPTPPDPYLNIIALIAAANVEIAVIRAANPTKAAQLNSLYNQLGTQFQTEINLLAQVIGGPTNIISYPPTNPVTIQGFTDSISGAFADDTDGGQASPTLEAIADLTNLTGQSIVAVMRRTRNATRITTIGGELEDQIDSELVTPIGTPIPDEVPNNQKPNCTVLDAATSLPPRGFVTNADYDSTVPVNLNVLSQSCNSSMTANSIYTAPEAQTEVEVCNCDCWKI
jgi:hypothetical protein